jgi:hypothetical protein
MAAGYVRPSGVLRGELGAKPDEVAVNSRALLDQHYVGVVGRALKRQFVGAVLLQAEIEPEAVVGISVQRSRGRILED